MLLQCSKTLTWFHHAVDVPSGTLWSSFHIPAILHKYVPGEEIFPPLSVPRRELPVAELLVNRYGN